MNTESELLQKLKEDKAILLESLHNPAFRDAVAEVPRELFIPHLYVAEAYQNHPISIEYGQTTSQVTVLETIVDLLDLKPGDKVLEVGAGRGYFSALLSRMVSEVYGTEIVPELVEMAAIRLKELGYNNAHIYLITPDTIGFPREMPYDKISVSARLPEGIFQDDSESNRIYTSLLSQLNPSGGILIAPVKEFSVEELLERLELEEDQTACKILIAHSYNGRVETDFLPREYRFVPYIVGSE